MQQRLVISTRGPRPSLTKLHTKQPKTWRARFALRSPRCRFPMKQAQANKRGRVIGVIPLTLFLPTSVLSESSEPNLGSPRMSTC